MRLEHQMSQRKWQAESRPEQPSGNLQTSYQRYVRLAEAAASVGDTIEMEHWYQHADHYFRMMRDRTAPSPILTDRTGPRPSLVRRNDTT